MTCTSLIAGSFPHSAQHPVDTIFFIKMFSFSNGYHLATFYPLMISSQNALVTPRAMSFLFTSTDVLVYTQKGHRSVFSSWNRTFTFTVSPFISFNTRGVAAFAHTWGPGVSGTRLWRANCLGEVHPPSHQTRSPHQVGAMRAEGGSTGVPLVGSTVGQVVVTRQGTGLVVR